MVSITLSIPEDVRKNMKVHDEINWSAFVRKCIISKTKKLAWKKALLRKLKQEKSIREWSVELGKSANKNRFELLKKKGFV